jgi:hypothetical protein
MKTKPLLNGVAVIAALALSAPVWAQPANPSGGNSMAMPGPSPGGPGLTPYSGGTPPASTSAMPPMHHHTRHVTHASAHHNAHHKMAPLTGSTANQLNQQELARLQTGSSMPPPAAMGAMPPPAPMPRPPMQPPTQGGNSMGMPGPNTGGPGLTPYSSGTPQR